MRIERVIDRLYCGGSMNDAMTAHATIQQYGVTHILDLNCHCDYEKIHGTPLESVEVLHYEVKDDGEPRTLRWCVASLAFAYDAMHDPASVLFIHCAAGHNRSVSICYGLLRMLGYDADTAKQLMIEYSERIFARDPNSKVLKRVRYAHDVDSVVEWLGPALIAAAPAMRKEIQL